MYLPRVHRKYFLGNVMAFIIADVSVNLKTTQTGVLTNRHLLYLVEYTFIHTKL